MSAPTNPHVVGGFDSHLPTIAIIDDHSLVCSGIAQLIEQGEAGTVIGTAGSLAEAVTLLEQVQPDIVLLDVSLPDGLGLELLPIVHERWPNTRVIVLSMHDDADLVREAYAAGASSYLSKEASAAELSRALRVLAADRQVGAAAADAAITAEDPTAKLGVRELEVVRLLALGFTNQEVSGQLYLSVRTVESHRSRIMQKLGLRSRAELVRWALDAGLMTPGGGGR